MWVVFVKLDGQAKIMVHLILIIIKLDIVYLARIAQINAIVKTLMIVTLILMLLAVIQVNVQELTEVAQILKIVISIRTEVATLIPFAQVGKGDVYCKVIVTTTQQRVKWMLINAKESLIARVDVHLNQSFAQQTHLLLQTQSALLQTLHLHLLLHQEHVFLIVMTLMFMERVLALKLLFSLVQIHLIVVVLPLQGFKTINATTLMLAVYVEK